MRPTTTTVEQPRLRPLSNSGWPAVSVVDRSSATGFPRKNLVKKYRDVAYIRRDIISKLTHHGELSQNRLMSYCGLNAAKHRPIIQQLVDCDLITRSEEYQGSKRVLKYRATEKGILFCQMVLEPYEDAFPRETYSLCASTIA